jgi:hypothetical protein
MVLIEMVRAEHGPVDQDRMCLAELHAHVWAIQRKRKLEALQHERSRDDDAPVGRSRKDSSLAKRGVSDPNAFKEFFAKAGLPVMDM